MSKIDVHVPGLSHVQMCPNSDSDILKKIQKQLQIFFSDDVLKTKNSRKLNMAGTNQHSTAYITYKKLYLLAYIENILNVDEIHVYKTICFNEMTNPTNQ